VEIMTPTQETERLLLRRLEISDAPRLTELFGNYEVLRMITGVAYPYTEDHARDFIGRAQENFDAGTNFAFAMVSKAEQTLIGCIELGLRRQFRHGDLGYWVGAPYWGKGYMTEAARQMLRYGFDDLNLNRIYSCHFAHNPASGRVMQKIGMTYEATLRQYIVKFDEYVDMVYYGILKSEWQK
jgi:[ribosomal protein S5]-alanine N-acetyltransferase